ncbi:unnamed protein product [Gongylonema pulchrum]|uniref:Short chain dehydrogenase n=1 Tax=Gongylonema pulchrum TaxID=637853 RepID=A0A183ENK4_9BILA|nr:unnamed protein product [Gongylonema pulchrum]
MEFLGLLRFRKEYVYSFQVNDVGLRNHYYCSVYAARMMVKRQTGLIINISSAGGLFYLFTVSYGVGKAAMDRMASDMAAELRSRGVTVVSLWPGVVRTELVEKAAESGVFEKGGDKITRSIGKLIKDGETPEFAGKAVVTLATDPNVMKKTGRTLIAADLGIDYKFRDIDGRQPESLRGLKMLLSHVGRADIGAYFPAWLRVPGWLITAIKSRL